MSWRSLFSDNALADVEANLIEMLRLDQRSYALALQALFGAGDVEQLRHEVSDTDHQVNLLVQEVRRQLIIHASVNESIANIPAMLTYMSIVKDIERIGDYAKNIVDIERARQSHGSRDGNGGLNDLAHYGDRIAQLLAQVTTVIEHNQTEEAQQLLDRTAPTLAELDRLVDGLTITDQPGYIAVPQALYCRYLKRIGSHLHNVLTSLTAPVDKLDFK